MGRARAVSSTEIFFVSAAERKAGSGAASSHGTAVAASGVLDRA